VLVKQLARNNYKIHAHLPEINSQIHYSLNTSCRSYFCNASTRNACTRNAAKSSQWREARIHVIYIKSADSRVIEGQGTPRYNKWWKPAIKGVFPV